MPQKAKVKLIKNFKKVIDQINKEAEKQMLTAGQEVRNEAVKVLSGSRSGRPYRVPGTKKQYTASAPGEAPASRTGDLRRSVKVAVEGEGRRAVAQVGSELDYAPLLEFGTRKMEARPWLKPAFDNAMPRVKKILARRWF